MASSVFASSGVAMIAVALIASSVHADVHAASDIAASGGPIGTRRVQEIDAPTQSPVDAVLDQRVGAGRHWRIHTSRGAIHVWIPADYDPATAATVVFVHGYWIQI